MKEHGRQPADRVHLHEKLREEKDIQKHLMSHNTYINKATVCRWADLNKIQFKVELAELWKKIKTTLENKQNQFFQITNYKKPKKKELKLK